MEVEKSSRGRIRCTATSRTTQKTCRQWAVLGKDKCHWHGGRTPVNHGMSSKYAKNILGDEIEQLRTHPQLLDLKTQIVMGAALQQKLLEKLDGKLMELPESVDQVRRLVATNGRLIAAHEKIYAGDENLVPVGVVGKLIELFAKAVNDHVEDERARRSLIETISGFSASPATTLH